mmetsp:Transcript_99112/g.264988  ORF Transcript_99112/g.264988 Transcript_99112/m.264988 type:complete len:205 (+) Transcript_99112:1308-1922(+)
MRMTLQLVRPGFASSLACASTLPERGTLCIPSLSSWYVKGLTRTTRSWRIALGTTSLRLRMSRLPPVKCLGARLELARRRHLPLAQWMSRRRSKPWETRTWGGWQCREANWMGLRVLRAERRDRSKPAGNCGGFHHGRCHGRFLSEEHPQHRQRRTPPRERTPRGWPSCAWPSLTSPPQSSSAWRTRAPPCPPWPWRPWSRRRG